MKFHYSDMDSDSDVDGINIPYDFSSSFVGQTIRRDISGIRALERKRSRGLKPRNRRSKWSSFVRNWSEANEEIKKLDSCDCSKILLVDDQAFNLLALEVMINTNFEKCF